jgi:hypothetical protein
MTTVFIKDDDDIFDSRGILKNGKIATTKMFAKDGSLNPDLTPAQRVAAAVTATRAAMTSFDSAMQDRKPGYIRRAATEDSVAAVNALDASYDEYARMQDDA